MKFQRIQDLRVDSDLSQKQIGEILHISQRSYSHYETGSRDIPVEMLIRLADYYNISLDYLVGRSDRKEKVLKIQQAVRCYAGCLFFCIILPEQSPASIRPDH